ncbi:MAG TPA: hypothetical protein VGS23_06325 [Thermoplasmata archaeon]|nr:hypothetical protein [Thermoplasmata archaeon]
MARNVLRNTLRLRKGENLLIETWSATLPWAESVVLEARILGARPLLVVEDEAAYWSAVRTARPANVGAIGAHEWSALKASDACLEFMGPYDTLQDERRPEALRSRVDSNAHEWFRILHKFGVRAVRWDLGITSEVRARRYGVSVAEWRRELIVGACTDPRPMRAMGRRLARVLERGREFEVSHPNGTRLTLQLAGRKPWVQDGIADDAQHGEGHKMVVVPSGVVGVTVDEHQAEGRLVANTTGVMFLHFREVPIHGSWEFRSGRLTRYRMDLGRAAFAREVDSVGPEHLPPGLVSIGLNPATSTIPLLFDQELGTVAFEIGRNSIFGGATRTPHLHAYLAVRKPTVRVDGEEIVRAGRITLPNATGPG